MTTLFTSNYFSSLLKFPFRDPRWQQKLLIAVLILLAGFIIPVLPWFLFYGYISRIMADVIAGKVDQDGAPASLPEWDDLTGLFVLGLKTYGALFIYSLPAVIAMLVAYATMMAPAFVSVPLSESGQGSEAEGVFVMIMFAAMMVGMCLFGLLILYSFILGIFHPAILGRIIDTGRFSAAFQVSEWAALIRVNLGGFLLSYLLYMALTMAGSLLIQVFIWTIILACITPFLLIGFSIYAMLIYAALNGLVYVESKERLEQYRAAHPRTPAASLKPAPASVAPVPQAPAVAETARPDLAPAPPPSTPTLIVPRPAAPEPEPLADRDTPPGEDEPAPEDAGVEDTSSPTLIVPRPEGLPPEMPGSQTAEAEPPGPDVDVDRSTRVLPRPDEQDAGADRSTRILPRPDEEDKPGPDETAA